jgi:hypothetical protein
MTGADSDLAFAHCLADAADAIALRGLGSAGTAWRAKSDGSPVSVADERIEHTLRSLGRAPSAVSVQRGHSRRFAGRQQYRRASWL